MMTVEPPAMFDVHAMIDSSQPRHAPYWWRWVVGGMLGGILFMLLSAGSKPELRVAANLLAVVVVLAGAIGFVAMAYGRLKLRQEEQQRIEQIEQLVSFRQWPLAAVAVHGVLLSPMRSHGARIQALVYLSSILARYHRFSEAIEVQNYLLENYQLEGPIAFTLRIARAMAMLREDHLLDADRAISELRRMDGAQQTAGLALVEMFRDVKTGHAAEAIEIFESRRDVLARQLGHRAADAYLLAAMAYDARGQSAEAAVAFESATLLAPLVELTRRYPESAKLAQSYKPAEAPKEAW